MPLSCEQGHSWLLPIIPSSPDSCGWYSLCPGTSDATDSVSFLLTAQLSHVMSHQAVFLLPSPAVSNSSPPPLPFLKLALCMNIGYYHDLHEIKWLSEKIHGYGRKVEAFGDDGLRQAWILWMLEPLVIYGRPLDDSHGPGGRIPTWTATLLHFATA